MAQPSVTPCIVYKEEEKEEEEWEEKEEEENEEKKKEEKRKEEETKDVVLFLRADDLYVSMSTFDAK